MANRAPTLYPDQWLDHVFAKLLATYGASAWSAKWAGLPEDAVRRAWAEALAPIAESPSRASIGLANLGEFVPNPPEFLRLCGWRPPENRSNPEAYRPAAAQLPPPIVIDPAAAQRAAQRAAELHAQRVAARGKPMHDIERAGRENRFKRWAWELRDRDLAGEPGLTLFEHNAWRVALRTELILMGEPDPGTVA